jgi:hypothetical protein
MRLGFGTDLFSPDFACFVNPCMVAGIGSTKGKTVMTDNLQPAGSAEVLDQRAEWSMPEVRRMSAGSAEADFNINTDGSTQTS